MEDHQAIQAILAVLSDYFAGLYTGDTERLRSVFHPEAALFAELGGQPYHKPLSSYLEGVAQRRSPEALGETYRMRVLSLDVLHNIAVAKVHVPALGFNYYNYLTLVRQASGWVIVNKVFDDVPVETGGAPRSG
jgi:hypothetical protein